MASTHSHGSLALGTDTLQIWGVLPHMHTLGLALNVQTVSGGDATCLVDVPQWDFDWQGFYPYTEPVTVSGSDPVHRHLDDPGPRGRGHLGRRDRGRDVSGVLLRDRAMILG